MKNKIKMDNREKILVSARKLFARQGFEGTTVRQICKNATTNVALLSYYFGSKECVLFSLFEEYFIPESVFHNETLSEPVQNLRKLLQTILQFKEDQPEMVCILSQELAMNTTRTQFLRQYITPLMQNLIEILAQGCETGVFDLMSIHDTAEIILSIVFHTKSPCFYIMGSDCSPENNVVCESMLEFILNAIQCKKENEYDEKLLDCQRII